MQLCVVTAEPVKDCVRLLDTGPLGVWVVDTEGALTPLKPRAIWQLFLTLSGGSRPI